jgi:hypothetical protein
MSHDDEQSTDITATESPWAKLIRQAVRREMHDLEARLCETLVNTLSPKLIALESRVDHIERFLGIGRHRDTVPAPPSEPPPSQVDEES